MAQAALLGLGIGETGLYHALPFLRTGQFKVVLHKSFRPASRESALQYPHRENLAPRVLAVVNHLLEAFHANADLQYKLKDLGGALSTYLALPYLASAV